MSNALGTFFCWSISALCLIAVPLHAQQHDERPLRIGVTYGSNFGGDEITKGLSDYKIAPFGELYGNIPLVDKLGFRVSAFWGTLENSADNLRAEKYGKLAFESFSYNTTFIGGTAGPVYSFDPLFLGIQPSVFIRAGVVRKKTSYSIETTEYAESWKAVFTYGFGVSIDIPITRALALTFLYTGNFVNTDMFDGFDYGFNNDGYSTVSAGISFAFFSGSDEPVLPVHDDYTSRTTPEPVRRQTLSPEDSARIRWTLETDRFFKNANLVVATNEFNSFDGLKRNPRDLRITTQDNDPFPSPLDVQIEFLHKGKVIARGRKASKVPTGTQELNASDIIDFDHLQIDPEYRGELPKGNYVIRLSVQPDNHSKTLAESEPFQILKLNNSYADSAYKVHQMIEAGSAEALFTESDEMIMSTYAINTPFMKNTSAVNKELWENIANRTRSNAAAPNDIDPEYKTAASLVPPGYTDAEAEAYLRNLVSTSFDNAIRLKKMRSGNNGSVPVIVAELFFAFDDASINPEGQIILSQVAREMQKHTEFDLELRGYADDVGESEYNMMLSRQRANNTRTNLAVQRLNGKKLQADGFGKIRYVPVQSPEWRQRARKVEILLID